MFLVYAIKSTGHKYIYVGMTSNLQRRFKEHNNGWVKTTRRYGPFKLIFTEKVASRVKTREKEKYLKSGIGKEYLKSL